jgi:hypothetical protein
MYDHLHTGAPILFRFDFWQLEIFLQGSLIDDRQIKQFCRPQACAVCGIVLGCGNVLAVLCLNDKIAFQPLDSSALDLARNQGPFDMDFHGIM